jgi:glucokinase
MQDWAARMILAGDIGGTNTRLAYFAPEQDRVKLVELRIFLSRRYAALEEILHEFLDSGKLPIERASFGVAGPVKRGRCVTSNLPWEVDARLLARQLDLESALLVNDLEANAHGIALLGSEDFVTLNPGEPNAIGNAALIAAGTGLGEAGLHWERGRHVPFASEGGHVDFAPRDETEVELLFYLLRRLKRVSYERVLSGPGLYNIYQFLRDTGRAQEPSSFAEALRDRDPAPIISQAALDGSPEICVRALDMFVSFYGAEAGNLVLKLMATGGLYIGGGIAPRIVEKLRGPLFWAAFTTKGRLSPLLEATPVRVIMNDKTALLGAAKLAASADSLR